MTGFWIGYQGTQIPGGFISDKIGAQRTYLIGLLGMGAGTVLTGFSNSYFELMTWRFLSGVFGGFLYAPSIALIIRWFPPERRATAMGVYQTSWTIGLLLTVISSPIIAANLGGWRWSFWLLSLPTFAAMIAAAILVKEGPVHKSRELQNENRVYSHVFRNRNMWFLSLSYFGLIYGIGATVTWIPSHVVQIFNETPVFAGFVISLLAISGIFGALLSGVVSDRIFRKRTPVLLIGSLTMGAAGFILAFLGTMNLAVVVVMVLLVGLAANFGITVGPAIFSRWMPLNVVGTASGFLNFLGGLGAIVAPFSLGLILDFTGSFALSWLSVGIVASSLAFATIPVMRAEK